MFNFNILFRAYYDILDMLYKLHQALRNKETRHLLFYFKRILDELFYGLLQ